MDVLAGLVIVAVVLGIGFMVYLSRSRARVMGYHDISTPRVDETTHGHEGPY